MLQYVLVCYAVMSLIAFICYGRDKQLAKKGAWRISEKTLLGLGFFGGGLGALLGMRYFRHKTRHWYFWCINLLGLFWQLTAALYLYWKYRF